MRLVVESTEELVSAKPQKEKSSSSTPARARRRRLTVGTDAWAQVVSDHACAEGGIEHEELGDETRGRRQGTRRRRTEWHNK